MITPKFETIKKDGKWKVVRQDVFTAYKSGLPDGEYELILQKKEHSKTLSQLAYLHGVVFAVASEASGYTREEVKGLLKGILLTRYVKKNGKEISYVPSLADLKKAEMSSFIEDVIIHCAKEWSCVIPSPDEVVN